MDTVQAGHILYLSGRVLDKPSRRQRKARPVPRVLRSQKLKSEMRKRKRPGPSFPTLFPLRTEDFATFPPGLRHAPICCFFRLSESTGVCLKKLKCLPLLREREETQRETERERERERQLDKRSFPIIIFFSKPVVIYPSLAFASLVFPLSHTLSRSLARCLLQL